jgi:hypothetical protein
MIQSTSAGSILNAKRLTKSAFLLIIKKVEEWMTRRMSGGCTSKIWCISMVLGTDHPGEEQVVYTSEPGQFYCLAHTSHDLRGHDS